jgi:transcriptional regulator GlxA family with amidase domain
MRREVAVLLYPGCIFFEVALAAETLTRSFAIRYYTPDGKPHEASNAAVVASSGDYQALSEAAPLAVLIPGGDPQSILLPENLARHALQMSASHGALLAGICAGNLVLAASGLLRGRRGTHNYTLEHAAPEKVQATAPVWEGMAFERANLVQDGRIITAQPWAYRQYAATVARELGVLTASEARELEEYTACRRYGDT